MTGSGGHFYLAELRYFYFAITCCQETESQGFSNYSAPP